MITLEISSVYQETALGFGSIVPARIKENLFDCFYICIRISLRISLEPSSKIHGSGSIFWALLCIIQFRNMTHRQIFKMHQLNKNKQLLGIFQMYTNVLASIMGDIKKRMF